MGKEIEVLAPLLNVNEPAARVVEVPVGEGQHVEAGAVLCALETTKAAAEVIAPASGYVRDIVIKVGDMLEPDTRICILTESAEQAITQRASSAARQDSFGGAPDGVRLTKAATALARKLSVDLSSLTPGAIVTEEQIGRMAGQADVAANESGSIPQFDNRIVIYGGGGHGKSLIDLIAQTPALRVAGVIDEVLQQGSLVQGVPILGARKALAGLRNKGIGLAANGVGGIRKMADRIAVSDLIAEVGFGMPALVHPRAAVEPSAAIEDGAQIFAHAYVGSACRVARGAIVNTGSILSHDCEVAEHAHIAPGAVLAGGVSIGARTLIGMGVTISLGVRIGSDVRVGNGAIISDAVPNGAVVAAGGVWPARKA